MTRRAGLQLVHKFDAKYDVGRLREELAAILREYEIVPHYRPYLTEAKGWGAITLVGANGDPNDHRPPQAFAKGTYRLEKTPVLRLAPYMESIIDGFGVKTRRVRLMQLAAGRNIIWHDDGDEYGFDHQTIRLHVPVITNEHVEVQVSHEDCRWREGELWYLDNSFAHRLRNGGTEARVHLVVDLEVSDKVRAMFPTTLLEQKAVRDDLRPRCRRILAMSVGRWMKHKRARERRREQRAREAVEA
jgi:hypothetical protein